MNRASARMWLGIILAALAFLTGWLVGILTTPTSVRETYLDCSGTEFWVQYERNRLEHLR